MLTYHRSSLLTSQAQTVVNTVNTHGVMGKGLAAEFKSKYPSMFEEYKRVCDAGLLDVGKLWLWKGASQWVLNFPTKKHWRYPSKLEWIDLGLRKFAAEFDRKGIREIAFPRLGCGNGGLLWTDVRPLMDQHLASLPIRVYIHDFETKVRQPEHVTYQSEVKSLTFHDFLCDIRGAISLNFGEFKTITNQARFQACLDSDNSLRLHGHKFNHLIDELDLYDIWLILQKGPVQARRMVGTAHDASYYLIALLSSLSYIRVVKVASEESEGGALAVELTYNNIPSDLLAA